MQAKREELAALQRQARAIERELGIDDEVHSALESLAGVGSYRWVPRTGQVVWSAQFRAIIGVPPDAPASFDGFLKRLAPEDQKRLQESTARAIATGITESLPVQLHRDDGSVRHLVLEGRFVEGGELMGAVLDVTRLRQLETDLLQAHKLEALGRLASGIAHDFNNVLAVLRLGLEARAAEPRVVGELFTAIERGASLTRQLLAFSRRNLLEPRPTEVRDLVQESVALVERLLGDAVRVKQEAPGLEPLVVHVDPTQLQQALINLFVNARDAMPSGGTVWVASRVRDLRASPDGFAPPLPPGSYVEVEVRDEGTGIAADVLPHIFEPFYTTKAEGLGTGLGLASVHGFLTQSGGGVSVTSAAGAGTTFRILLPRIARASAAVGPDAARPLRRGKGERILVIDDLPAIRETLAAVLTKAGFVPICVDDLPGLAADPGRVAASCHAVMTDLDMPGYRGEEVARLLRRHAPRLPVLFMSGHAVPETSADDTAETAFLAKPFSGDQAIDKLTALLGAR